MFSATRFLGILDEYYYQCQRILDFSLVGAYVSSAVAAASLL